MQQKKGAKYQRRPAGRKITEKCNYKGGRGKKSFARGRSKI